MNGKGGEGRSTRLITMVSWPRGGGDWSQRADVVIPHAKPIGEQLVLQTRPT
jgi:hypothetical protein